MTKDPDDDTLNEADKPTPPRAKAPEHSARDARLKAALRANLARRKSQRRARRPTPDPKD